MKSPLRALPSIGPSLARDLELLGYRVPADLIGQDGLEMYQRLERITGTHHDPCVLDSFRCAVYAASTPSPDPALLLWWSWSRLRKAGMI